MFPLHKTLAYLAVGTLAVAAIALVAVEAGQLHKQVRAQLERRLNEHFVGHFEARRLSGNLVWQFTAHDLQVRDASGEPVAYIDELQIDASAFELLDGTFRFDRARLVRPTIFVERYADGSSNVDDVFGARRLSGGSPQPDQARPAGEVVFEMARAEVVDGTLLYVDADRAAPPTTPGYFAPIRQSLVSRPPALPGGRHRESSSAVGGPHGDATRPAGDPSRALLADSLHAEGSFQVRSGGHTRTRFDRLDAEVVSDAPAPLADENTPRHVRLNGARIDTGPNRCIIGADSLTIDDHWRVDDLLAAIPKGPSGPLAGPIRPIQLRAEASTPDGGGLKVTGYVDRRDDSYQVAVQARDFKPADWPGAPRWPWLVLDGNGAISGRGWAAKTVDATIRWTARDIQFAGRRLDAFRLVAHVGDGRVDVDSLDITADGLSSRARGHLNDRGGFAVDLDAQFGGLVARQLAAAVGSHEIGARLQEASGFELSVAASGRVDPGGFDRAGFDAANLVDHADIDTTWKAGELSSDETGWRAAGGSLKVQVPSVPLGRRAHRRFSYKVTAAVHELHFGAFGADILRATASGDGVVDADDRLEGLSYKLEADGDRVTLGKHRTERARLVLSGALSPADDAARWPLKGLAAQGSFDLFKYRTGQISTRRVATQIDLRGPFPVGQGTIKAHATGLRIDGRRFRSAQTELRLLDERRFHLESKARVEISLIPDLPMYLDLSGRYGRDLEALTVDTFTIGRPGMRWKTRQPGLVLLDGGGVELKSLALHRGSQQVDLDGEYGHGKQGSVSAVASRLTRAQLRSFFDPRAIF